jgi:hypothetical protein
MKKNHAARGVFTTHFEAEASSSELQQSESGRKKLSIVGKDYQTEEQVAGSYNTRERMMDWGKHGAFWGGLWGMMFGSALFVVGSALFVLPGIGPLLVIGPLAAWVVGILGGAIIVGGLSTLAAALVAVRSETTLKSDKYLVIAGGRSDETTKAESILETGGATHIDVHPGTQAPSLSQAS